MPTQQAIRYINANRFSVEQNKVDIGVARSARWRG